MAGVSPAMTWYAADAAAATTQTRKPRFGADLCSNTGVPWLTGRSRVFDSRGMINSPVAQSARQTKTTAILAAKLMVNPLAQALG